MVKSKKKGSSKKHSDVYDNWIDYSRDISERINEFTNESAGEYKELYSLWSDYAQNMSDKMAKFTPEDESAFTDIQNMWRDYSEEMGERFVEILKNEKGPYKELYKMWTDYSAKMGEQLSDLMSESLKEQHDLYELWMDSFGIKDNGNEDDISDMYKDIYQFWQNMWGRSNDIIPPFNYSDMNLNTNYKELSEFWTNTYSKMVKNVINSPDFAKMDGNILKANLEALKITDELINQYLSAMGLPTKNNLDDIYQKLHDMDRKISEISRAINSKKK
ncbi:MAG: hypothetical protein JSW00_01430 [Thermoplasmata archaeon]|nr:MAG: hypothetical protein JSW00_01430 [Thermoplasmata archaeon]